MDNFTEAISGLRRLPWLTESDKPAYLSADDPNSLLATMADTTEDTMLATGDDVLSFARELLGGEIRLTADEMQYTSQRLAECLHDALNVARMRGERLGMGADE